MADRTLDETHLISAVRLPTNRKALENLANAAESSFIVLEGGIIIPAAFAVLAVVLAGTAVQEFLVGKVISTIVLGILAFFLAVIFVRTLLRRRIPLMTLTPEGIITTVFTTPVSWLGVDDFQINSSKSNAMNVAIGMEFLINKKYLPNVNEKCRGGSYYDEKTKKLMISGFNFRLDTNRDKLIAMIDTYRKAALARRELALKAVLP